MTPTKDNRRLATRYIKHRLSPYVYPGLTQGVIEHRVVIQNPENICRSIGNKVCDCYSIQIDDLMTNSRHRHLVEPRQMIMKILKDKGISHTQIGRFFRKDHTTSIYSVTSIENRLSTEPDLKDAFNRILNYINN